jgi:hypothetical protein
MRLGGVDRQIGVTQDLLPRGPSAGPRREELRQKRYPFKKVDDLARGARLLSRLSIARWGTRSLATPIEQRPVQPDTRPLRSGPLLAAVSACSRSGSARTGLGVLFLRDFDFGIGDGLLHRRRQLHRNGLPCAAAQDYPDAATRTFPSWNHLQSGSDGWFRRVDDF